MPVMIMSLDRCVGRVGTWALLCSPLPGHKVGCAGKKDAIGDEAKDDDGKAIHKDWTRRV